MKTPKEILLEQHRSAVPKLDAMRAEVIAGMSKQISQETESISWRDWLRSMRWHFAGLGAAWVLVLLLSLNDSAGDATAIPSSKLPTPQQFWASLQENRRQLAFYLDTPAPEPAVIPGKRSDASDTIPPSEKKNFGFSRSLRQLSTSDIV